MHLDIQADANRVVLKMRGSVSEALETQQLMDMQMTIAKADHPIYLLIDICDVEGDLQDVLPFIHHLRSTLTAYRDLSVALYAVDPVFIGTRTVIEAVRSNTISWFTIFEDREEAERYIDAQLRPPHRLSA